MPLSAPPDLFDALRQGRLSPRLAELLSPFSVDEHERHVASLDDGGTWPVLGLDIASPPGLYRPHAASSSLFILRTLLRESPRLGRLLELGCGTGVLGLTLLNQGLADTAELLDVSDTAVQAAQANAVRAGLAERVRVQRGDLFGPVRGERFDSVLFNLPLMHADHAGRRHLALDDTAGHLAQRFFAALPDHLSTGGRAIFSYANISDPAPLDALGQRMAVELLAAEWVARSGFWLFVYQATAR
jgi:release factor glutamine methyltransferase